MERGRAWRRYKLDCFFVKRIKRQVLSRYVYIFWGRYPKKKYDPLWIDKISSKDLLRLANEYFQDHSISELVFDVE
jgi:hypothetical protein